MARVDEVVFLRINGWVGTLGPLDRLVEWLVSDYLIAAVLGLGLLTLWFAGADGATRLRYQIGVLMALTGMALSSWMVFISNGIFSSLAGK